MSPHRVLLLDRDLAVSLRPSRAMILAAVNEGGTGKARTGVFSILTYILRYGSA